MGTEIERKFAVVDSTVSPSFDGLSAVSRVEQLPVAATNLQRQV